MVTVATLAVTAARWRSCDRGHAATAVTANMATTCTAVAARNGTADAKRESGLRPGKAVRPRWDSRRGGGNRDCGPVSSRLSHLGPISGFSKAGFQVTRLGDSQAGAQVVGWGGTAGRGGCSVSRRLPAGPWSRARAPCLGGARTVRLRAISRAGAGRVRGVGPPAPWSCKVGKWGGRAGRGGSSVRRRDRIRRVPTRPGRGGCGGLGRVC